MAKTNFSDLEQQIDDCMLIDRFRLRRDLKRKNQRDKVISRIARSSKLAQKRSDSYPEINYPPELPVSDAVDQITSALASHQVVVVAGETGSGKTTQIPKICLAAGRGKFGIIGHTQPRRVAARTIAHRLAQEWAVKLGDQVGYQVRFQDQTRPETLIKVMTDGVLLAETQNDRFLERYDTIIIDEAHERSLNIDFLLGYLKRILPKRPDLKVIITSATIDVDRFSRHFGNAPVIEVSGRTFPVELHYRPLVSSEEDDTDESISQGVLDALAEIEGMPKGDVLIFLPGEREIREIGQTIRRKGPKGYDVLPLYSRLGIAEQNRVFQEHTGRRVVLATNVAETSITVPGIRYVIDPGTARISRYSIRSKVQQLPVEPVSQASADQRKGRCGRVADGVCFRLYSEEDFDARPAYTDPEILRTNLASVILQMLVIKLGDIQRFPFVEKPAMKQINDGFALLFELGAVTKQRQVTRLGKQISRLPVDLKFARMLVAASQLGCLNEMLVITCGLTIADPRERPFEKQQAADEKHKQYWDEDSDFLSLLTLWQTYEAQRQALSQGQLKKHCKREFLSFMRMREWRETHRQLLLQCKDEGYRVNDKPADYSAIHRAIVTGLLGNIANRSAEHEYVGARNRKLFIFPASSQFSKKPKWIVSAELAETTRLFARCVARIDRSWIEPLAGHLVTRSHYDPHFSTDLGQVVAREEVSLYGLVLVSNRTVDYGFVNSTQAREIFIDRGLVHGELKTKLKFFQHNRRLIKDIERMESKSRRRDILIESRALFDFYDQCLPADMTSEIQLREFVNAAQPNAENLKLTKEELMQREAQLSKALYPDRLKVGGSDLPLNYKFEPGGAEDGVSVTVPVMLLNQVSREQLDWIIPGLLKEKCLALIKSLPKSIRKNFVPAPDYVDKVLEQFEFDGRAITEALADRLFRISGTRVNADDFQAEQLDSHLTLNIRVADDQGKVLASDRNLENLLTKLESEIDDRMAKRRTHPVERSGLMGWDMPDFPETVEVREGGVTVNLFPALVDEGEAVSIRLIESRAAAERETARGLVRLYTLELASQRKFLSENILDFDRFSLYYATRGSRDQLIRNIVDAVFRHVLVDNQPLVRSRTQFEARFEKRADLADHLNEVARLTARILPLAMSVDDQVKSNDSTSDPYEDVKSQMELLVTDRFPADVSFPILRHYPRYLKAIEERLSRFPKDPEHDSAVRTTVRYWAARLEEVDEDSYNALEKFRWMLEEFRVSQFAQALGTSMRVSEQRLEKEWQTVMGKRR